MRKFHILINDVQKGPFTIDELKNIELNKSTLIWFKELDDWTELHNIEELKFLFEDTPPPIPKKSDKKEIVKKETANQIVNVFKLIKISLLSGVLLFIGLAISNNLVAYGIFDKKFNYSQAEKILGFTPSEYVFKETSHDDSKFELAYGFMEISESGEKTVKKKIVNKLLNQAVQSTLILTLLTFIFLVLYYYIKKGFQWTKKYSD